MTSTATIEHQLPGRLRLRIPTRRGDVSFFQGIVHALSECPDVKKIDATPLGVSSSGIRVPHRRSPRRQRNERFLRWETSRRRPERPPRQVRGPSTRLPPDWADSPLFQLARGQAIGNAAENFWMPTGRNGFSAATKSQRDLPLLGIFQLLRGELLGSASSLLFYSLIARQLASLKSQVGCSGEPE